MPGQEQVQETDWSKKKKKHENKQEGNLQHEAAPSKPTYEQTGEQVTNTYCYRLLVFCGWLLCSITVSTANYHTLQ